jgi:hypothetical protein
VNSEILCRKRVREAAAPTDNLHGIRCFHNQCSVWGAHRCCVLLQKVAMENNTVIWSQVHCRTAYRKGMYQRLSLWVLFFDQRLCLHQVMFFVSSMRRSMMVVCPYHWLRCPHFLKSLHLFLLRRTASHLPSTWLVEH